MSDNETKLRGPAPSAVAPPATGAETRLRMPSAPQPAPPAHTDAGMGAADGPETQFRPLSPPAAESLPLPPIDSTASDRREQDAKRPGEEVSSGRVLGGRFLRGRRVGEGGRVSFFSPSDKKVREKPSAKKVL